MGHHQQSRKANVGLYSGCDYPYTNLVCVLFGPAIPTSSFNFIVFYTCINNMYNIAQHSVHVISSL